MMGKERQKKEAGHYSLVDGRFNKQGTYFLGLSWMTTR